MYLMLNGNISLKKPLNNVFINGTHHNLITLPSPDDLKAASTDHKGQITSVGIAFSGLTITLGLVF